MSKANPTATYIQVCHQAFINTLLDNQPDNIRYIASNEQIEARAAHLKLVLNAALTYAREVFIDTGEVTPCNLDDDQLATFEDVIHDLTGAIQAGAYLREEA